MHTDLPGIKPVIVGELTCRDQFGNNLTPQKIYFAHSLDDEGGNGFAVHFSELYGTSLLPVYKNNGERLRIEGYNGLCCHYNSEKGDIRDFYEE